MKKWSKLCWNCFKPFEDLKKCAKCKIAVYCGKKCQAQDWKTHKIRHDLFYGCVKSLMEMPRYVNISNLESLAPKERPHRLVILANPATPIWISRPTCHLPWITTLKSLCRVPMHICLRWTTLNINEISTLSKSSPKLCDWAKKFVKVCLRSS